MFGGSVSERYLSRKMSRKCLIKFKNPNLNPILIFTWFQYSWLDFNCKLYKIRPGILKVVFYGGGVNLTTPFIFQEELIQY